MINNILSCSHRCTGRSASTTLDMVATIHKYTERMTTMTWTLFFRSSSWLCLEGMEMVLVEAAEDMVVDAGAGDAEAVADADVAKIDIIMRYDDII